MRPQETRKTLEPYCRKAMELLDGYEFTTFLVGTTTAPHLDPKEALRVRRDVNRVVGIYISEALPGKEIDAADPDMVILVDLQRATVKITPSPVFVYGRYQKFARTIPQTRWHCRNCRGRGCTECGGTGRLYDLTIEDAITAPFLEAARPNRTKMHGMGREDVDAQMLGNGRPFVLELVEPRIRTLDLATILQALNEKHAGDLRFGPLRKVGRDARRLVKSIEPKKTYRVVVESERDLTEGDIEGLRVLDGAVIQQRTPLRVSHRRADKVRERKILAAKVTLAGPRELSIEMTTQAGTYVKELITGDEGRTQPSVTGIIGAPCLCKELDVLAVHFYLKGVEEPPADLAEDGLDMDNEVDSSAGVAGETTGPDQVSGRTQA